MHNRHANADDDRADEVVPPVRRQRAYRRLELVDAPERLDNSTTGRAILIMELPHYEEKQPAALVLMIGVTNLFNRLNATKQVAGAAW